MYGEMCTDDWVVQVVARIQRSSLRRTSQLWAFTKDPDIPFSHAGLVV